METVCRWYEGLPGQPVTMTTATPGHNTGQSPAAQPDPGPRKDHLMDAAVSTPPTVKEIEEAAMKVHAHVRQAVDHAQAGDYRRAHAEAEQAQGAARRLKELLAQSGAAQPDRQPDRETKFTE